MRALLCTCASPGFAFPMIGLGLALSRRGHETALATGARLGPLVESAGLERIPRGEPDGPSFHLATWMEPEEVALQLKHLQFAVRRFRPDVLVAQPLTLGPLIYGAEAHLPVAVLGLATYLWPASGDPSYRAWLHSDMVRCLNEARELLRLEPVPDEPRCSPLLGDVFMLRSERALEGPLDDHPDRVHFVGDCLWEPDGEDPELRDWLTTAEEAGEPVLYVQQGATFDLPRFWPLLVEALANQPVRVAASLGRMHGDAGALPRRFFTRPHVSQEAVLRHARAVICSGNTTAILGAASHGIPALVLPGGGEQPILAERLLQAGAGLVRDPRTVSADDLLAAVEELLRDPRLDAAARRLGAELARVPRFQCAVELLDVLATTRRPVRRRPPRELRHAG